MFDELYDKLDRGCVGKSTFHSKRMAKNCAKVYGKRYGIKLYLYRCPYCRQWHLTRREGKV